VSAQRSDFTVFYAGGGWRHFDNTHFASVVDGVLTIFEREADGGEELVVLLVAPGFWNRLEYGTRPVQS
jgi:hypothetical protein